MLPELSGFSFPLIFPLALGVNELAPILWKQLGKSFTDFDVVFVGVFCVDLLLLFPIFFPARRFGFNEMARGPLGL